MVDHCDFSLPTMTVSFCAKDCDNPLGSVEVIPPMRVINSGSDAYAVGCVDLSVRASSLSRTRSTLPDVRRCGPIGRGKRLKIVVVRVRIPLPVLA